MDIKNSRAQSEYAKRIQELTATNTHLTIKEQLVLYAQCFELQCLKAPLTAIFPPIEEWQIEEKETEYRVTGYVDAQNSFGALIRTSFTLSVSKDKEGKWVCDPTTFIVNNDEAHGVVFIAIAVTLAVFGFILFSILK